ncbi:MAG: metal-sensing transcriptional repressor [Solobacterium sp.]|nr:metal-sensing transcriptional repressor [Solobacterium sp.]
MSNSYTHTHDGHTHTHEGHAHTHTHDPAEIKKILNRFSRSIGHLESVRRMVERGEDCSDVLIQLAAVRGELNKISQQLLKEHLDHCIKDAVETGDLEAIAKMNEAIEKLIK